MPCTFCPTENRRPAETLTAEHVFPAFIGGKLKVANGSCDRCNREFGKEESTVKKATRELLNLLKIKNRDGVVPSVPVKAWIKGVDMAELPAFVEKKRGYSMVVSVRDAPPATSCCVYQYVDEDGGKVKEPVHQVDDFRKGFPSECWFRGEVIVRATLWTRNTGIGISRPLADALAEHYRSGASKRVREALAVIREN